MSLLLSDEWLAVFVDFCITGLAALGLYVCFIAGQISLAQGGLMAAGGYAAAELSVHTSTPFALGLIVGLVAGTLTGIVMAALLALRLKEFYLAIGTLAFQFAVIVVINNTDWLGGPLGLIGVSLETNANLALVLLVVCALGVWLIEGTRFGRALRAIEADEQMAAASGVSVWRTKLGAYAIAGGLAGLAGALLVHNLALARPDQFDLSLSIDLLVPVIVGGIASVRGPLLGAAIVVVLPYVIEQFWAIDRLYISGVLLIAVMTFRPTGILPLRTAS